MVVCEYLLDSRFLVFNIDRLGGDAVGDDSVCWDYYLGSLPQALDPVFVLFKVSGLGCAACEYLYVSAFKLVCGHYLH